MPKPTLIDTRKYYYHITDADWPDNVCLHPKRPISVSMGEPDIKRICVAPTTSGCLSAVAFRVIDNSGYGTCLHIYRTKKRVRAYLPYYVYDSDITGECWLLEPTEFIYLISFSPDELIDSELDLIYDYRNIKDQQRDIYRLRRVMSEMGIAFNQRRFKIEA